MPAYVACMVFLVLVQPDTTKGAPETHIVALFARRLERLFALCTSIGASLCLNRASWFAGCKNWWWANFLFINNMVGPNPIDDNGAPFLALACLLGSRLAHGIVAQAA